ncbi:MAG: FmdB family zinc ribbon protein [Opitutaceae bacterium]
MPTYIYETVPQEEGQDPKQFELQQSMKDAPLTTHPETGEPVRRLISGGYGFVGSAKEGSGDSCGTGCGCC